MKNPFTNQDGANIRAQVHQLKARKQVAEILKSLVESRDVTSELNKPDNFKRNK